MKSTYTFVTHSNERQFSSQYCASSLNQAIRKWIYDLCAIDEAIISNAQKERARINVALYYEYIQPISMASFFNVWTFAPIAGIDICIVKTSRVIDTKEIH